MSVRCIRNHGKWVWQARVASQELRRAAFRGSREDARQAEAELRATWARRATRGARYLARNQGARSS